MLRILSLGSKNWLKPHGDNEKTCHMVFVGKQELYASGDVRWPWLKLIFLLVMVQMALAAMLADSFLSSTQQLYGHQAFRILFLLVFPLTVV